MHLHDILINNHTNKLLDKIILSKLKFSGNKYNYEEYSKIIKYVKYEMKNKFDNDYTFEHFMDDINCSLN